jgi:hypothetical protein
MPESLELTSEEKELLDKENLKNPRVRRAWVLGFRMRGKVLDKARMPVGTGKPGVMVFAHTDFSDVYAEYDLRTLGERIAFLSAKHPGVLEALTRR